MLFISILFVKPTSPRRPEYKACP